MMVADQVWLPQGPQLALVKAVLDPGSTLDVLEQWQRSIDFEQIDWAFAQMVPMLMARIDQLQAASPQPGQGAQPAGGDVGRLRGLCRRNFYVNTITLSRINDAVDLLSEAGITCVLGGGLAALTAYPDVSCRWLPDAELIVAATDHARAGATLTAAGWTTDEQERMCHRTGAMVKLTSRLRGTAQGLVVDTDDIASTPTTLTGRVLPVIDPALAVIETAIAAVWPQSDPPIRWVVDLELLMPKVNTAVGLEAIVSHARDHRGAHLVRVALSQARRLGARSIPVRLLSKLARVPVTELELSEVTNRTNVSSARFRRDRIGAATMAVGHRR
ncbi:MAG: hypothetical protein JWN99_2231 [Ilumatobacteraceae bacterium]|nr:hypothetical protein [Ilumatobacteraceae bacterium]